MSTVALSRLARTLFTRLLAGAEALPDDMRACLELERAGLVVRDGDAFRITEEGEARRGEFLPMGSGPSREAMELFRRRLAGERVEVTDRNRVAYRELAAWGLMAAGHSFAGGDESIYAFTKEGFARKAEFLARESA